MSKPDDDIRYLVTDAGVDIRFPRPVTTQGTMWGTRIALTEAEALLLHHRLSQFIHRSARSPLPQFKETDK